MKTNLRLLLACLLALFALGLPAAPRTIAAPADTIFTVDTTADLIDENTANGTCLPGSCSLRAAIMQADVIAGPDVTIIVPSGIYTLTRPRDSTDGPDNGDLNLLTQAGDSRTITLLGAGAASTIIDANTIDRVLSVGSNSTATLSGFTLRNGKRLDGSGGGVVISGTLTISDSVIEDNQTNAAGGGLYDAGTLTLTRSTLRSNIAFLGGGLYVHGAATIRDSALYGNRAGYGGGIEVSASGFASNLVIVNSTLSQNSARFDGGGIDSEGATYLYNTSIIGNDADHDHGVTGGRGGGVYANASSLFQVVNTLIAGNTLNSPSPDDCYGTLRGYGWNLLGDVGGCDFNSNGGNGDMSHGFISVNTIGPLQNNGGPTLTHALLPGSEAIDTTYSQGCIDEVGFTLTTDQRGFPRGVGAACDVGAFEYSPLRYLYLPAISR